jgi:hypothetical protein
MMPRRPASRQRRQTQEARQLQQREEPDERPEDRLARREPPQARQPERVYGDDQRIVAGRNFIAPPRSNAWCCACKDELRQPLERHEGEDRDPAVMAG